MTTEAVEDFFCGTDGKRRRLLLVEGTTRHPVRALLLELHIVLYHPDDVCLPSEIVDECLGVTHLFEYFSHGFPPKNGLICVIRVIRG
jgi:hypothetical protein